MTEGELQTAIRRALNLFDQWNSVTEFVPQGSSYIYEIEGLITDAVHCGAQAGTGDFRRLETEPAALYRIVRKGAA